MAAERRLGYQLSPRIGTFVQGNYSWREYDDGQTSVGGEFEKRDNQGWRAAVGTDIDITSILFGEMSVRLLGARLRQRRASATPAASAATAR